MKKLAIVSLLALVCWLYPINVLAQKADTKTLPEAQIETKEKVIFINYEQFHKQPAQPVPPVKENKSVRNTQGMARRDTPYQGKTYTREEIQALIISYSEQYGINPEIPLCIAKLESGYNQFSKNKSSTASGVMQYLSGTWQATDEGKAGISVFDADANVRAAIKYMASRKNTKPWTVANRCPSL